MGVSIREYARQRGVSDTAVRKVLKQGCITAEPDGTIDVDRADREWSSNTAKPQTKRPVKTKPVPAAAVEAVEETLKESGTPFSSGGTTYMQAKTANEVLKAQTERFRSQGNLCGVLNLGRFNANGFISNPNILSIPVIRHG